MNYLKQRLGMRFKETRPASHLALGTAAAKNAGFPPPNLSETKKGKPKTSRTMNTQMQDFQ